jgi:hypothetical protein
MAYRWYCVWENGASSWEDSDKCRSHCKVLYSTEKKAEQAADAHAWRFGHNGYINVERIDGRRFKGWKIV